MLNNSCLKVGPSLDTIIAFESICSWKAGITYFQILLKMLNEIAPINNFISFDQFDQVAILLQVQLIQFSYQLI